MPTAVTVVNELARSVLVELELPASAPQLSRTTPLSQVIPSGCTAGFDIAICSMEEEMLLLTVGVIINGLHRSTCVVSAAVIPISVQVGGAGT